MGIPHALKRGWRWLAAVVAFALIAAAVLLTVLRLALPLLSEYRGALEQRLSTYLDAPVEIGGLDVEWHGLGPRLRVVDLRVAAVAPRREPVHFAEAYVDLALAPTAPSLPFRIRGLSLVGLELDVRVDRAGRLELLGFSLDPAALVRGAAVGGEAGGAAPAGPRFLDRLFAVQRLELLDARIRVLGPGDARALLPDTDIELVRVGDRHRLSLAAELPQSFGEHLRVAADLRGQPGGGDWGGRVHVSGEGLALPAWMRLWRGSPVVATEGRVDASAWTHWGDGKLQRALVEAHAEGLGLARAQAADDATRFERLGGRVAWRREPGGWQLDVGSLEVERGDRVWPGGGFSIARVRAPGDDPRWRARFDFARLEDLAALARLAPLPGDLAGPLAAHAPRGDLHELTLDVRDPGRFRVAGRFEDLGWAPHGRVPGADGLDGELVADAQGGRVDFDTAAAELRLPLLFRGPLPLARLAGRVRLERGADGALALRSERLALANQDLTARGRLHVRIQPGQSPWLDLQAEFAEGDVGATSRYLPAAIMPDDVVAWLDRALEAGRVTEGTMLLRGRADAFPYRGREGVFDVDFEVADARIAFAPEWPALTGMRGRVHFAGPALTITADRGRLYDSRVPSLRARFDDLEQPLLGLEGRIEAPMSDVLRALGETPLRTRVGEPFGGATGAGTVGLELGLEIPLDDVDATRVDGRFRLSGARLAQPRFGLELTDLRGVGTFTHGRLEIDGLEARLHGQPVAIDATTDVAPTRRLRFLVRGRLALHELVPALGRSALPGVSGRAPWRVEVAVPADGAGAAPIRVLARSDLAGIGVDLPAPFAKPADAARALRFDLTIDPGGGRHVAHAGYGDAVRAAIVLAGDPTAPDIERLRLRFGGAAATLPGRPGVHLTGALDDLELDPWLALIAGARDAGDGDLPLPAFASANLRIARARLGGHVATAVQARTTRVGDGVAVELDSNELAGRITWPGAAGGGRAVRARFDWVDLALLKPSDDGTPVAAEPTFDRLQPGSLPPLDLRIGRIELADGTVHDAALVTSPAGGDLTIHRLQFDNKGLELAGQGTWTGSAGGRTRLRLTLTGSDFGAGLAELGYPALMQEGSGRITGELEWPAAPWSPSLAGLSGHATLELEDGVIERVDVGPARILGLLSLNVQGALREGFPYDEIRGRVDFADGNAYTRGLVIDGPPGRIQVNGRTGLVARDYDQTIRFRPQLSRSLPVIGALSGGPVTGIAVAVVQALLRNLGADVEKVTELTYSLTGSWADPRVQRVSAEPAAPASDPAGDTRRRGR